jgi:dienelactone hydrolase
MSYLWYWPDGGWDFEEWKRHAWEPIWSEQSGNPRLAPLLRSGESLPGWTEKREHYLPVLNELLGSLNEPTPALKWERLDEQEQTSLTRSLLRYTLTDDELGYAWLLHPHKRSHPLPAVIALHQTVPQGKEEPVGLNGDAELSYGLELARRGYIVLAPDAIGFGDRQRDRPTSRFHSAEEFFTRYPNASVMAKMTEDIRRAVDLLQSLPEVDGSRIGCIGHSHGGYGTLFALLGDDRIKAGVISCGMTPLRADPTPERWWRRTALIPRLGYYEGRIEDAPLDFHHLLALVAPRPLMVAAALEDEGFPNTYRLREALDEARKVYGLYDEKRSLSRYLFHGPHSFPKAARSRAYRFFETHL